MVQNKIGGIVSSAGTSARKKIPSLVIIIPVLFIAVLFISASYYTVDQGDLAVILRNGAVSGTSGPGLHFKIPLIDSVETISTRTNSFNYEKVESYSKDIQTATLDLTVTYHLDPAKVEKIYSEYKTEDNLISRILNPNVYSAAKTVFGNFTAAEAVQRRGELVLELDEAIKKSVAGNPLVVEAVQLQNIDFSDAYERASEERALADVATNQARQIQEKERILQDTARITAQGDADQARIAAQGQADSALLEAKSRAEATRLQGEAEAYAIREKVSALKDNPSYPAYLAADRWNGVLPTTMLPNGSVPLLDMRKPPEEPKE